MISRRCWMLYLVMMSQKPWKKKQPLERSMSKLVNSANDKEMKVLNSWFVKHARKIGLWCLSLFCVSFSHAAFIFVFLSVIYFYLATFKKKPLEKKVLDLAYTSCPHYWYCSYFSPCCHCHFTYVCSPAATATLQLLLLLLAVVTVHIHTPWFVHAHPSLTSLLSVSSYL